MNSEDRLKIVNEMSPEDWKVISTNLFDYNVEHSKGHSTKPGGRINLTLKGAKGEVVGGISCRTFYQSLSIDHL